MHRCHALVLAAALAAAPALAAERLPPPRMDEAVYATRVDSTIEIGPDGRVVAYEPITELKDPLAARVRGLAEGLRFEPVRVDGKPVIARTRMRMHLVAQTLPDGNLQVGVEHVGFPQGEGEGQAWTPAGGPARGIARRTHIEYPREALMKGVSGRVMVAMRYGLDGRVLEAVPRQSALFGVKGGDRALGQALAVLERAAVQAVRRWTVDVQVPEGATPRPADLTAAVNIEFFVDRQPRPRPGLWMHESRSRERPLPWVDPMLADHLPHMADVGEGVHFGLAAPRFRLLTPMRGVAL